MKNTCSFIIDNGSCCNCCSTRLAERLNLTLIPHPKPYKFHWLNEDGDLKVKDQVDIKFFIGKYKDRVLCDVILMEACHILLERPWKFDRKTRHNGHTHEVTFLHNIKKFVLHPLSHTQVAKDQAQLRARRDEDKTKSSTLIAKSEVGDTHVSCPMVIPREVLLTQKSLFHMLHEEQPSYLVLCQETLTSSSSDSSFKDLPPCIVTHLQLFDDVFPKDGPHGLSPIRGIEHQIDFVPRASLPID